MKGCSANGHCARVLMELALDLMADGASPSDIDAASRLLERATSEAKQAAVAARLFAKPSDNDPPF